MKLDMAVAVHAIQRARQQVEEHVFVAGQLASPFERYGVAVVGISLASLVLALIRAHVHNELLSLIYLLVVLGLAVAYGAGPAVMGSILAFIEYDFFFIPPYYQLIVSDLSGVISLIALLITGLLVSYLVAAVRSRQQRTEILYALTRAIATDAEEMHLLATLAAQTIQVFAPAGVRACAISMLPDERQAVAAADDVARSVACAETPALADLIVLSIPLASSRRQVGVMRLVGAPEMGAHLFARTGVITGGAQDQGDLFAVFRDQIALALERMRLQQEAIHVAALQESDRLKTALLGSVTHDLRTPLAAIQAAASSMLDADIVWSDAESHEFLESISTSADRLGRLVRNLLDLSRLEAGVAIPEKQWYPISEVIAAVLDRLDLAGQTRHHKIVVDLPDALPLVPLDPAQIEQVVTNLVENALKYAPEGSYITIAARSDGDNFLEVSVADQGIGIPEGEQVAIFDKFYRVQQAQLPWGKRPVGTGLGLAICAAIIQTHGGRIWVESTEGQGATFRFTLPIPLDRPRGKLPEISEVAYVGESR